jgi:hypothetical protein
VEITGATTRGSATDAQYRAVFDRLHQRGCAAVLAGTHYRDTPPVEGGRWGPTVVFGPDRGSVERLAAVTDEAIAVAGPGHWPTGAPHAVHITVRAIQAHRVDIPAGDLVMSRAAAAMARAALGSAPPRFRLSGLAMTPSGVMACAYPHGDAADRFAQRLRDELGDDAWFEDNFHRDIWYATLVHFTEEVPDPAALVAWVGERRDLDLGVAVVDEAELIRSRYDGRQPVRVRLAASPLARRG